MSAERHFCVIEVVFLLKLMVYWIIMANFANESSVTRLIL